MEWEILQGIDVDFKFKKKLDLHWTFRSPGCAQAAEGKG